MNGFTFFRNYYEAINDPENDLSEEEQGKLYNAIFAYMFDGKEPVLRGACKMAFNLIKPSLDISRARSEARKKGVEKANGSEEDGDDSEQNKIKTQSNQIKSNQSGDLISVDDGSSRFDCDLTFQEERSKEVEEEYTKSFERKKVNKKTSSAGAREGAVSHEDVMNELKVPSLSAYREKVREFLTACYVNGHIVTNEKLRDIISRLDTYYGDDESAKIRSLQRAISGGFFDVEELRLADPLDRVSLRRTP